MIDDVHIVVHQRHHIGYVDAFASAHEIESVRSLRRIRIVLQSTFGFQSINITMMPGWILFLFHLFKYLMSSVVSIIIIGKIVIDWRCRWY